MENNRTVPVVATVIMVILCVAAVVVNVIDLAKANLTTIEDIGFFVLPSIAAILAMIYCLANFKKKTQKYYRVSMCYFAISQAIIALISFLFVGIPFLTHSLLIVNAVCAVIEAICLFILAFGLDLGVVKSKILAGIILALSILSIIVTTSNFGITYTSGIRFTNLVLAIVVWIMVYGKYLDKSARGTK